MRTLLLALALSLIGCVSTLPEEPSVKLLPQDTLDVFEAAVRSRIAVTPLSRHSMLYLFVNEGALPQLAARFPEYHTTIRSGSPGNSPISVRWYFLSLGRTSVDHAFVYLEEAHDGLIVELRRSGKRWSVTDTRPAIIT